MDGIARLIQYEPGRSKSRARQLGRKYGRRWILNGLALHAC
jgi:hypothetical protein